MPVNPYARQLGGQDPLKVIRKTPQELLKLVGEIPARALRKPIAKGKWSVYELIGHLADCEVMFTARCRLVAFDKNPVLASFDQDRWMEGWRREKEPLADALVRFLALREAQIRLFRKLPAAAWRRKGTHQEAGPLTLRDLLERCAGHDRHHLAQIRAFAATAAGK
jgi:uncharacterized damage-inducible protein DinB